MNFCNKNSFSQMVSNAKHPLVITALATPYKHGKLHAKSLERLVANQNGTVDALLCLGTTGEANFLTEKQAKQLLSVVNLCTNLPIVVGICANTTQQALRQAELAVRFGAKALLVSPPSFSKCTEDGFVKHVLKISKESNLPIVLYNAPNRAAYSLDNRIVALLAEKGVNFVKDAASLPTLTCAVKNKGIQSFCGNDLLLQQYLRCGAIGTISVASNVAPQLVKEVCNAFATGNQLSPNTKQTYLQLAKLCALQTNPVAVKYILYKTGVFDTCQMRLPLTPPNKDTRRQIDDFLQTNTILK